MSRLFWLAILTIPAQAAPTITRLEPPNWWFPTQLNPIRILIQGAHLTGAKIPGATNIRVNANGTYAFADLAITHTGRHILKLTTPEGTAAATFEVLPPLPAQSRFQGFSPADLIYLIMPDRFANGDPANDDPDVSKGLYDPTKPRYYHGGDLQGIIDHFTYLKDLGVTTIWLNPIYDNVNHLNQREKYDGQPITDYHGYGAVDFYNVDEHLGTLAKFRELVEKAHSDGLKIILDMVANHTGPYHPWVEDSPTPTWFHGTAAHHPTETWQTWTLMDPHAPPSLQSSTLDGWFIDILPDLNQDDPEVARYLIQNSLWWIGISGLDGIRQDTLPYVPRRFWRDWMHAIKSEYPKLRVVGEMFDGDPALVSFFQGGRKQFDGIDSGVDSLFDFPQFYKIREVFAQNKSMRELATMLAHDYLYPDPNLLVTFLGLHDVSRFMNEPGATTDSLKLAFTYLLTSRGIPMLYYGDEIAMPGGNDPDNRRDFPSTAFSEKGPLWNHIQKLARLRTTFVNAPMQQLAVTDTTYAYSRGDTIILFNNGKEPAQIECPAPPHHWHDALGTVPDFETTGPLRVTLAARSAAILLVAH